MASMADLEKIVNEGIDVNEDIAHIGRMLGMKSLQRNLKTEDESLRKDYEKGLGESLGVKGGDGEDMDIMVAHGDVHIYERPKEKSAPAPEPPAPATATATVTQPSSGLSKWANAAIIASALGIPTAGIIGYLAGNREPVAQSFEDTDTRTDLDLLPPGPQKKASP